MNDNTITVYTDWKCLGDSRITPLDKLVYCYIKARVLSSRDGATQTNGEIAQVFNAHVDSIRRSISKLESLGYIHRSLEQNHKRKIFLG